MAVTCGKCKRNSFEGFGPETLRQVEVQPDLPANERWCAGCEAEWQRRKAKFPKEPRTNRTGYPNIIRGVQRDQFGE